MRHTLQIRLSKHKENAGIVTYRHKNVREKILSFLLGNPVKVTVIVPGDTVEELAIKEIGGTTNA